MLTEIKFYFSLFLRRIHYFLIVATAISAVGVTIAYTLPPVYEAEAQLLVESPQIPDNLAVSTVRAETPEILQIIKRRLLTRANLLDIARTFDVYEDRENMSPDAIVDDMRRRISLNLPRRRDAAAFVQVSFAAPNGKISAQVTNELVTRILAENVSMRKAVAGQTLEFFTREVARLDQALADQGQLILQFQLEHKDALPDSLNFRRTRQASLEERMLQLDRELVSLRDGRTRLQQLYEQTGSVFQPEGKNLTEDEKRLKNLKDRLAVALTLYSERNPKIRNLRDQVKLMEQLVAEQTLQQSDTGNELSPYELQMADIEGQIGFLAEQKIGVRTELQELAASIEATPSNAVQLGTFQRDYENLRVQYNQATADLAKARTGDQIEAQSRGQRITVIEQAVVPKKPTDPNRKKIAISGIGSGMIAGLAIVALLELLNGSIRRPVDLTTRLGIQPLVTVPYIRTRWQRFARRAIILVALAIVTIGIPTTLYLLHEFYLPMDMMIAKVMQKTGLADLLSQLDLSF